MLSKLIVDLRLLLTIELDRLEALRPYSAGSSFRALSALEAYAAAFRNGFLAIGVPEAKAGATTAFSSSDPGVPAKVSSIHATESIPVSLLTYLTEHTISVR
jgi:hypothetical protein